MLSWSEQLRMIATIEYIIMHISILKLVLEFYHIILVLAQLVGQNSKLVK